MPLIQGHSRKSLRTNIAKERAAGKPLPQAVAIAMKTGRAAWRKKHKVGAFPKRLAKK